MQRLKQVGWVLGLLGVCQVTSAIAQASIGRSAATSVPVATPGQTARVPDDNFPRYDQLKPAVSFWTHIFSRYSELQSVVHSSRYPDKVFTVLDFRGDAATLSETELARRRRDAEQDARDHVDALFKSLQAKQYAPAKMTGEERRLYDLFADVPGGADKFKKQIGTVRVQRGLRERTQNALAVSDRYLPAMEATFQGYSLPTKLTRLPLVESSFDLDAYSRSGAAGIWQFIPSSARVYMRLNNVVDDRRDPWTSTDAAARHLRDDYAMLGDWPLAITAYNHGRNGIARALDAVGGKTLIDIINRYDGKRFGFASKNYYAEFLAAVDIERDYRARAGAARAEKPVEFEIVETRNYVPYDTLRRLCGASDEAFRRLNPAYRPEVIEGKLYVPPGHLIRVPYGSARAFEVGYAKLGAHERFDSQRAYYALYKVKRGDNLSTIARRNGVSQRVLMNVNELRSANMLRIGQILKIPPKIETRPGPVTVAVGESKPAQTLQQRLSEARKTQRDNDAASNKGGAPRYRTHKVRRGQTLSGIARQYNVSVRELRNANHLKTTTLHIGQRLKVPLDS